MSEKELGKITAADLFIEDHGILTLYLLFDYGGRGQGFGGYSLDTYSKPDDRRVGTAAGMDFVLRVLQLFKVDRLSQVVGRAAYTFRENGILTGLELPPYDGGERFMIADWQKRWFPEAKP